MRPQRLAIMISLAVVVVGIVSIAGVRHAFAYGDPIHCDRFGWPTCYSVGDANGKAAADNDFQSGKVVVA